MFYKNNFQFKTFFPETRYMKKSSLLFLTFLIITVGKAQEKTVVIRSYFSA